MLLLYSSKRFPSTLVLLCSPGGELFGVVGVKDIQILRRMLLSIGIGILTFGLGVSATVVYWLSRLPQEIKLEESELNGPIPSTCFPGRSVKVKKSVSHPEYFWPIALPNWYSKRLRDLKESPLLSLTDEDETYRFLWLRSFHNPIAIHISKTGSRPFMVVKELRRMDRNDPREFLEEHSRSFTIPEWNGFMLRLEVARYWQLPANESLFAEDGAQWILEGYREGRYHVVDRQTPAAGAYRDACLYLLQKSGLLTTIPSEQVY